MSPSASASTMFPKRRKLLSTVLSTPSLACLATLIIVFFFTYQIPPELHSAPSDGRQNLHQARYHRDRRIASYRDVAAAAARGDDDAGREADSAFNDAGDQFDVMELDMTRDADDQVRPVKNAVFLPQQEMPVKLQYNRLGFLDREGIQVSATENDYLVQLGDVHSTAGLKPVPIPECPRNIKLDSTRAILDTLRRCTTRPKRGDYRLQPELEIWRISQLSQCDGRFVVFDREAVLLKGVVIDRRYAQAPPGGHHPVNETNWASGGEFYRMLPAFLQLACVRMPRGRFREGNDCLYDQWLQSFAPYTSPVHVNEVRSTFTFALARLHHHSIYHSMGEIYNVFLAMHFFNLTAIEVDVVFIDAHPAGLLDPVWGTLFNSVSRLSQLKEVTFFEQMMWPKTGNYSELLEPSLAYAPYLEELRQFVLSRYSVDDAHRLNCSRLNILIISRADYVINTAVNGTRTLSRKIANEPHLMEALHATYPTANIITARLENLPFKSQLELSANADILIGMHGGGLTHALFLPQHAGVFEMSPKYWTKADDQFKAIANWRQLYFIRWRNYKDANEVPGDEFTVVPPDVFINYVARTVRSICREYI